MNKLCCYCKSPFGERDYVKCPLLSGYICYDCCVDSIEKAPVKIDGVEVPLGGRDLCNMKFCGKHKWLFYNRRFSWTHSFFKKIYYLFMIKMLDFLKIKRGE